MRLIGDIHGDIGSYLYVLDAAGGASESVQVGDFGMGFLSPAKTRIKDAIHAAGNHKFIRGNHDDPALCKEQKGWIPDGTYDEVLETMYVGGAWSIDHQWRTPGVNWWPDEELNCYDFDRIIEKYIEKKPRVMVTHDAPHNAAGRMFFDTGHVGGEQLHTRTAEALQQMWDSHTPDLWVFGHWHIDTTMKIAGTEFVCLGINSYIDL